MNLRTTIAATLVSICLVSAADAAGRFGRRHLKRTRAATPARPAHRLPESVLRSPEEMTRRFGPSILVRSNPAIDEQPRLPLRRGR